eukprot:CAMPEP_0181240820 /NCGR_PEP_ID=MMETSP1096-20121128/40759_1 /TAXON_ID=156174 ORGANISM="Chrysochromulina ericina, Strain CCMP281" /NCGR_SAMPLE_ID=MMETSP1096 /ASSEMBLY_ACC=CAM_ASM_000453 /LENGTH=35 /DNA_ID= /DNA_START= /DNA_END= /DNA_ORIENTATION=
MARVRERAHMPGGGVEVVNAQSQGVQDSGEGCMPF